jgi:hypothetical protein
VTSRSSILNSVGICCTRYARHSIAGNICKSEGSHRVHDVLDSVRNCTLQ